MKLLFKELITLVAMMLVMVSLLYNSGQVVTISSESCGCNTLGTPEYQSRVDYYKSQIIHPVKLNARCTLLVPTYKRVRMLILIIQNYCAMSDSLEKIVVVWNDVESEVPSSVLDLREKCGLELKILHMTKNKLSNRFLPGHYLKEIVTECK